MKKTILVTGANKGIGLEIVRQLAAMQHTVILTARNEERGKNAVETLQNEGISVHFMPLDVTDKAQIEATAQQVKTKFGHLDVLIHNAGILLDSDQSILSASNEDLEQTIHNNAFSAVYLVSAFYKIMPRGGRIVHMSSSGGSMSGMVGGWSPIYCASKTLMNAFTRHQANELQPFGITVNAMSPGWVRTDMGGSNADRHVSEGADTAVWLAVSDVQETGRFFKDRRAVEW